MRFMEGSGVKRSATGPALRNATTTMQAAIDNHAIYQEHWPDWVEMKKYGPASRWLRWLVEQAISEVDASAIRQVLDVGCGEGTLTAHLSSLLPKAHIRGIDVSGTGVQIAHQSYGGPSVSFACLPVQDDAGQYDLVSAFEVLEHIEDWLPFVTEMAQRSRRYLLLSFPTGRMRPFEVHVGHYRNFAKGQMEAALADLGFVPRTVRYAGFPFYSPLYRELCQLTNAGSSSISTGSFGPTKRLISDLLYAAFRLSSHRHWGDQFCGVFERA
jgi:SAM-dependent methyltransferase